jgi:hypothetical protein
MEVRPNPLKHKPTKPIAPKTTAYKGGLNDRTRRPCCHENGAGDTLPVGEHDRNRMGAQHALFKHVSDLYLRPFSKVRYRVAVKLRRIGERLKPSGFEVCPPDLAGGHERKVTRPRVISRKTSEPIRSGSHYGERRLRNRDAHTTIDVLVGISHITV